MDSTRQRIDRDRGGRLGKERRSARTYGKSNERPSSFTDSTYFFFGSSAAL
jgi:hypothetical protein